MPLTVGTINLSKILKTRIAVNVDKKYQIKVTNEFEKILGEGDKFKKAKVSDAVTGIGTAFAGFTLQIGLISDCLEKPTYLQKINII